MLKTKRNNQTNTFLKVIMSADPEKHLYYWSVWDIKIFDITSATWWNCTPKQCPPNIFISHLNKNYKFFLNFDWRFGILTLKNGILHVFIALLRQF